MRIRSIVAVLAACLAVALPITVTAQSYNTYTAQAGVTLFTGQAATATATSNATRLPTFAGYGVLNINETGITGSPSGCSIALKYQQNNVTANSATAATVSFTPSTGTQQLLVNPTIPVGDQFVAVFTCSTYPTAGALNVTFSPMTSVLPNISGFGDPCKNPTATTSNVVINTSGAGTTQLVALSAGKSVYVCDVVFSVSATTATAVLEYGTGSSCGSGTTALTGAMVGAANSQIVIGWGGAVATAPAGNALCIVNGGTGTQTGVLSYVQQ